VRNFTEQRRFTTSQEFKLPRIFAEGRETICTVDLPENRIEDIDLSAFDIKRNYEGCPGVYMRGKIN
jgi:hypothetical protein